MNVLGLKNTRHSNFFCGHKSFISDDIFDYFVSVFVCNSLPLAMDVRVKCCTREHNIFWSSY